MSSQRYIDTGFYDDAWVQELDPSEKFMYMYLLTNPLTNIAGIYKITKKRMSFDTGFSVETVVHILEKFTVAKKASLCGEYIIIRNWPKHQKWEQSPKVKEGITRILSEIPEEVLVQAAKIGYSFNLKPFFDTLHIPYPYSLNYLDSNLDSNLDNNDLESSATATDSKSLPLSLPPSCGPKSSTPEETLSCVPPEETSVSETENSEQQDLFTQRESSLADNHKPKESPSQSERQRPGRKSLTDTELEAYFSRTDFKDFDCARRIVNKIYESNQHRDPKYRRSKNFLDNSTRKLLEFARTESRNMSELESVFMFASSDSFWSGVVTSADVFLRNYEKMLLKSRGVHAVRKKAVNAGKQETFHVSTSEEYGGAF